MKKLVVVLGVVGLLLGLLVAGALYADSRALAYAEDQAQRRIADAVVGAGEVTVSIDAWPLMFAVATGRIEQITVTVDRVLSGGVQADELELLVHDVALDTDALWSDQRIVVTGIGRATLTGTVSQGAVSEAVGTPVEFAAGMVKVITPDGRTFFATLKVEGRHVLLVAPIPGFRAIRFDLPDEDILPCTPAVEVLEGKLALRCDVTELPPAVRVAIGPS
ncbi:MAG: DUF2993 domain-containing protein [Nannocystaceae bacterium]|nr:DUF2993 domain-containing protein [Nannocystaceae bacterium]